MMELKAIRYFVRVAELRSFSKAAQELNIAQPAISRQIQALEEELGTKVLFRTTRGVELTEPGKELLREGREILQRVNDIKHSLSAGSRKPSGIVTVGIPPSSSELVAPLLIKECSRNLPDVELRIIEGLSVFLNEWLNNGRIDIAIMSDCPTSPASPFAELLKEDMVLAGTLEAIDPGIKTISARELCDVELVLTRAFRKSLTEQLGYTQFDLNCAMEIDSVPAIRKVIADGRFATVLPLSLVNDEVRDDTLRVVAISPMPTRRLVVGTHPRAATSSAAKAVCTTLLGPVREAALARTTMPAGQHRLHATTPPARLTRSSLYPRKNRATGIQQFQA